MNRRSFSRGRSSRLYWSQFSSNTYVNNPTISYFKFLFLLIISVAFILYVPDEGIRNLFFYVGGMSAVMIIILLIFGTRRLV